MKTKIIKIFILLFVLIYVPNIVMAEVIHQEKMIEKAIADNKNDMAEELKDKYRLFKDLIASNGSYEDVTSGWLYFDNNNDKLMIGSSGAVFCGYTMKKELLQKYGYDLIGFGGIFDEDLVDLLTMIKHKKYRKIVFFGGVNDLNIRALYKCDNIDLKYCIVLHMMLDEAQNHLMDNQSQVYYIKIKPMTYNRDFDDESFVKRYNNMAKQINDNVELFGFKSYDIPFDTVHKYTDHYIHYNNKMVYETMFKDIG